VLVVVVEVEGIEFFEEEVFEVVECMMGCKFNVKVFVWLCDSGCLDGVKVDFV